MADICTLVAVLASAVAGVGLGFVAGLVPGLHMNNIAAAITTYTAASVGLFSSLGGLLGVGEAGLLASCFISSAVVAHIFAEAVSSAYVGIPAEDVVSVLPAHRLAKAGLGAVAVRAAADGALAGIVLASALLLPMCVVMGEPIRFYSFLGQVMWMPVVLFSVVLILSEAWPSLRLRARVPFPVRRVAMASCIFAMAGTLGFIVLETQYCSCGLPDFPWTSRFISRSSLLLPMFAGLFGVPSLILSLGSRQVADAERSDCLNAVHRPSPTDLLMCALGGVIVGWLPGMTSGSAATLCAPGVREDSDEDGAFPGAVRFIWLYSSISAAGAVFAVGALFVISRARSGSMDAVSRFLGSQLELPWVRNMSFMGMIILSLLVSALLSHMLLLFLNPRLARVRSALCSRRLALTSLAFVCGLSAAITGTRGLLVMSAAVVLGLLPPLTGTRRIQLMGCLLLPLAILLLPI